MTRADETLLRIARIFDASPAQVFRAWLDREEFQSWIGPEGVTCQVPHFEPHVGGHYRIVMNLTDGQVIRVAGAFQAIEAPRRIVFTWGPEGDADRQSLITITFEDRDGKTALTLRQEGLGTIELRDSFAQGWSSAFNKLARYLARALQ